MSRILVIVFCFFSVSAFAQKETIKIQTSASCFEGPCCKERIEEEMQFTRGVTAVDLDIESAVLTITFKTKKTNSDKLRKVISSIGYHADDVKADKKAHDRLPSCCRHLEFTNDN